MIKIENFSKHYGEKIAVSDLSLTLNDGEVLGLLGHNGAGKSTTIKSLVGILPPTTGSFIIDGVDMWQSPTLAKNNIAYVSDTPNQFLKVSASFYWNFIGKVFKLDDETKKQRLDSLLKRFEFEDSTNMFIEDMSHGMRQKVFVIGALLSNPSTWILDEPMTGLDPKASFELKSLMREHADKGHSVLFSTHILEVAEKICDRIAILKDGKLLYVGTPADLKNKHDKSSLEDIYLTLTSRKGDVYEG